METKKYENLQRNCKCLQGCGTCIYLIVTGFPVWLLLRILWMTTHYNELFFLDHPGDISNAYQIVRDWNTKPFVMISVHDGECPED